MSQADVFDRANSRHLRYSQDINNRTKPYLSPNQIENIKRKIVSTERWLREHRMSPFARVRGMEEGPAQAELVHLKKMLEQDTAPVIKKTNEKNTFYKRVKELEKIIKEGMPTFDEMMGKRKSHSKNGRPNSKYQEAQPSAVEKNIKWVESKNKYVHEWKRLKRILEPDDSNATNVENLRPYK